MKKMEYIFKKVKIAIPHCKDCGEILSGNNSFINPYRCKCGLWQYDWFDKCYYLAANKEELKAIENL